LDSIHCLEVGLLQTLSFVKVMEGFAPADRQIEIGPEFFGTIGSAPLVQTFDGK
jgi:hypothetical protein